jgi:RimJ/RimL family protein N-acetyltransferase
VDGLSREETWRRMAYFIGHWELRGFGQWALFNQDSGELVGRAGLLRPEGWPGLEVGWLVARAHWGRGFAPEAGRASLDWARDALGADHVISLIEPDNERSARVAEKLGMTLEGHTKILNGEIDVRIFGIDLGSSEA